MRRHPPTPGQVAPRRDHRQRRADRLHRPEDPVGSGDRTGGLAAGAPYSAAQGLRALQADRRLCVRCGGRRRHHPLRSEGAHVVARGAGCARHCAGDAADDTRRPGSHGLSFTRGSRSHRPAAGPAGHCRRRRPGGGRRGCGRGAERHRLAGAGYFGRGLCDDGRPLRGARRPAARVLPFRARSLAPDGRHALGGGEPALVSRHLCARREL